MPEKDIIEYLDTDKNGKEEKVREIYYLPEEKKPDNKWLTVIAILAVLAIIWFAFRGKSDANVANP